MRNNINEIKKTLRESYAQTSWWELAQIETKQALVYIIDNIQIMGIQFRDAFIAMFAYEHLMRIRQSKARPASEESPLFGKILPEECYLSGKHPVKAVLHMDDWFEANDADVNACMVLCQQIDLLESMDILMKIPDTENLTKSLKSTMASLEIDEPEKMTND